MLRRHFLVGGLVFGGIAFFMMNLVVIPLTRIGRQPFEWTAFAVGGVLLHVFLLGPAAAYFASRASWEGGSGTSAAPAPSNATTSART